MASTGTQQITIDYFTTAYFHRPEELEAELARAGLDTVGIFGIEGPCALLQDFADRWVDPRRRADMMMAAEAMEAEPALLGISPHWLAVARKCP